GCIAVLPNRLSYPEIVPEEFHGAVLYEPGGLGEVLRRALTKPDKVRASTDGLRPAMGKYDWSVVGPAYDQAVDDLVAN
ncbi:MAG: tRNA-queuosine alpha-mannosyltransferase domain-containing protein, partial [Acidimicrobiales bacterium]